MLSARGKGFLNELFVYDCTGNFPHRDITWTTHFSAKSVYNLHKLVELVHFPSLIGSFISD